MTTRRPPQSSVRRLMGMAGLGSPLGTWRPAAAATAPRMEVLESRTMLSLAFVAGPVLTPQTTAPAIIADFDGDGDGDMAVSSGTGTGMLSIFLNDGTGAFTLDDTYDWGGAVPTQFPDRLRVLDMDDDGDNDLISNGPVLWLNDGSGVFGPPTLISFGFLSEDLIVYNYNNDDLPDIAVIQPTGTLVILQNNSGVNFTSSGVQTLIEPDSRFLTPGRVNGDTQDDLLYWTPADGRVRSQLLVGTALVTGPEVASVPALPIAARLNADNFIDVIWSSSTAQTSDVMVAFNDGAGAFNAATVARSHSNVFGYPQVGALADFDGDTTADLLVRRQSLGANEWVVIPGDGLGHFDSIVEVRAIVNQDLSSHGKVLVGDLTEDGRADIVRHFDTSVRSFISTAGPTIGGFTVPSSPVIPGRDFTLNSTGLATVGSRAITGVRFYEDTDQNGRLNTGDLLVGTAIPSGAAASLESVFGDRRPWGDTKYFAVADDDAAGVSSVSEGTAALWTRLFFPEGWRNIANVNEHVPMANPHEFEVDYEVILHYERPDLARDYTFQTGTIPPHTRWGVTTAARGVTDIPVIPDAAYAFEVLSSAPIAAQLARYDTFNIAISGQGESFTNRSGTQWGFANVTNRTLDFILFFNPFETDATVHADFYPENGGEPVRVTRTIPGFRRSGIAIFQQTALPDNSDFSVIITSDQPIAVSESRYNPSAGRGMATLGQDINADPTPTGATRQVITGIDVRAGVNSPAVFFNPNDVAVSFTLTGTFQGTSDTTSRVFVVQAHERTTVELTDNVPNGATTGTFRIDASAPMLMSTETSDMIRLDSLATNPATYASREWAFGDGWLDPNSLGVNSFASINLYNPSDTEIATVTLRFLFDPDEPVRTLTVAVPAAGMFEVRLDQTPELTEKPLLDWYSTVVVSNVAVVASMTHWDLYNPGGWTTLGVAIDDLVALPEPSGGGG